MTRFARCIFLFVYTLALAQSVFSADCRHYGNCNNGNADRGRNRDDWRRNDRGWRGRDNRPVISTEGAAVVAGAGLLYGVVSSVANGKTNRQESRDSKDVELARIEAWSRVELARINAQVASAPRVQQPRSIAVEATMLSPVSVSPRRLGAGDLVAVSNLPPSMTCVTAENQTGFDLLLYVDEREVASVPAWHKWDYHKPDGSKIADLGASWWSPYLEGGNVHFDNEKLDPSFGTPDASGCTKVIFKSKEKK